MDEKREEKVVLRTSRRCKPLEENSLRLSPCILTDAGAEAMLGKDEDTRKCFAAGKYVSGE